MEKIIRITCDTKLHIHLEHLNEIQGKLKEMTKANFVKLRKWILQDGFNFPIFVWKELALKGDKKQSKWWIVDGHGRKHVVSYLVSEEGYQCPPLPCVEIEAGSYEEAKRKVLNVSSSFNTMTNEGLYQFLSDSQLGIETLDGYSLPEIDVAEFKVEFFDTEKKDDGSPKETVTFDAYQNAAIKQIVLYFPKDEYEKVIAAFDQLVEKFKLEDHSQVVWRLLGDAVRATAK